MTPVRFAVAALLLALIFPSSVAAQDAPKRSIMTGVYTEEQAERGRREFESVCASCHRAEWFGSEEFREHWAWGELFWLWDYVRTTMPYEQGGSLPAQTYRDVIAYILKLNEFPVGTTELPRTDEEMMAITFPDLRRDR